MTLLTGDSTLSRPRELVIVMLVPRFHTNLYFAVRALVDAGHKVHLVCGQTEGIEDHSIIRPIYPELPMTVARAFRLLRDLSPDLLIIRRVKGLSLPIFTAALLRGDHVVGYDQRPYFSPRSWRKILSELVRGRPMRRLTPVLGLNRAGFPDRLASYIPFPVENPSIRRKYAPGGVVRILMVGKLSQRRKKHLFLIEALKSIRNVGQFTLTLVGSTKLVAGENGNGYIDAVMSEAKSGLLAGQIDVIPDLPFQRMSEVYSAHDICVLPSISEPLGTAPLEGMAFGCVPIISRDCGSAGYIDGKNCGFLIDPDDRASLENALESLVSNPSMIAKMGEKARSLTESEFSAARFVERIEGLFDPDLRKSRRSSRIL
jgi:glycosyltransferase involved in cell wall biosynthesis